MASSRYPLLNCKLEKVPCIWWASLQSEKTSTVLLRPLTANYCPAVAAIKQFYCTSFKAEPLPRNVPHVLVLFSTTRICIYLRADVAAKMSTFKLSIVKQRLCRGGYGAFQATISKLRTKVQSFIILKWLLISYFDHDTKLSAR